MLKLTKNKVHFKFLIDIILTRTQGTARTSFFAFFNILDAAVDTGFDVITVSDAFVQVVHVFHPTLKLIMKIYQRDNY